MARLLLVLAMFCYLNVVAKANSTWEYSLVLGGQVASSSASSSLFSSDRCIQIYSSGAVVATAKSFDLIIDGKRYKSQGCSLTTEMKEAITHLHSGQRMQFTNMTVVGSSVCPRVLQDKVIQIK